MSATAARRSGQPGSARSAGSTTGRHPLRPAGPRPASPRLGRLGLGRLGLGRLGLGGQRPGDLQPSDLRLGGQRPGGLRLGDLRLGGSSARRTPFVAVVIAMLAVGLVGQLLLNTSLQRGSFQLHEMQATSSDRADELQELEGELAARESPAALAARARLLGMVPSGAPVFLTLVDGSVQGTPTPAPAPTAPVITPAAGPPGPTPATAPAPAAVPGPVPPTPAPTAAGA